MESEWKVCSNCRSRNPAPSRFCDQCGSEMDGYSASTGIDAAPASRMSRSPARWTAAHATDPGLVRKENEDAWAIQALMPFPDEPDHSVGLFLVADGMGGAAAGEVASRMAVQGFAQELSRYLDAAARAPVEPDWGVLLKNAVAFSNHEIFNARQAAGNDMGTTLVGALLDGGKAIVVNVGDSRAYHINRTEIRRVSKDHSLVQGLVDTGQIAPEEMRTHPQRNLIMRSLGGLAEVQADIFLVDFTPGEWLLLCSDGLWEMVTDSEIHRMVVVSETPEQACSALIQGAKDNGGHDNVTVVLIEVGNGAVPQSPGSQG